MFVFPPQKPFTVPITGLNQLFPVHQIYCVGQNYVAHAQEMGVDPDKNIPVFFMKPADSIVVAQAGKINHPYPSETQNYHYEVELVVAIGKSGKNISLLDARDYIYGYAVGLDMTKRDLQKIAKDKKDPWEVSKAFADSALISPIHLK